MAKAARAKYVFRGSTIGWPGNSASRQMPRTPTTTNPVKAFLFAICCHDKGVPAVIYVAGIDKLKGIKTDKNVLAKVEEETGYIIAPKAFIELCDGYITTDEAINIFLQLGLKPPLLVDKTLLDMALKDVFPISDEIIAQFYIMAKPLLKNT